MTSNGSSNGSAAPDSTVNGQAPHRRALVGVTCNMRETEIMPVYAVGETNIHALTDVAGVQPILLPGLGSAACVHSILDGLDGLFLTGGVSNVEPQLYDGPPSRPGTPHDAARDLMILPMIVEAVARGIPVFAACRGIQEMNVAYGGSLHQYLHEVPGRFDHRRPREQPKEVQLGLRHKIHLTPGGYLHRLVGDDEVMVNSLHSQGIDRVGPELEVEALASDGTVEAIRVRGAKNFALGVQWHPEWYPAEYPFYKALFEDFGAAANHYAAGRVRPQALPSGCHQSYSKAANVVFGTA